MAKLTLLLFYNAILPLGVLFMAPAALKKLKARGGSLRDLWQRFGFFRASQRREIHAMREEAKGRLYWVHAASVGEVGIAAKLIKAWCKKHADVVFVLTTTTPTGFAQAQALQASVKRAEGQGNRVIPLFSPLDGWFVERRYLNAIKPVMLVLVEAEVWPNLTFACERRGVPMTLINARLSPRSERRFRKFGAWSRALFSSLTHIYVQEPEDVERWMNLGVARERLTCTGSIKFDPGAQSRPVEQIQRFQSLLTSMGWKADEPTLLLASTHPGEELALAAVFEKLADQIAGLKLMIAPRHVERSAELRRGLEAARFQVALRSEAASTQTWDDVPNVLLIDTTGELRVWQHFATVVVIGKSFLAKGGQNPAEALMAGRPVVFGPRMENFEALVTLLLNHQGAVQVANLQELAAALHPLLSDEAKANSIAQAGQQALLTHEGATHRTLDDLHALTSIQRA